MVPLGGQSDRGIAPSTALFRCRGGGERQTRICLCPKCTARCVNGGLEFFQGTNVLTRTSYRRPAWVLVSARAPRGASPGRPLRRAKTVIDEHFNADGAQAFLKEIYLRKGTEAAVEAAKDMVSAGAAWIAQESGADEARRITNGGSCATLAPVRKQLSQFYHAQ